MSYADDAGVSTSAPEEEDEVVEEIFRCDICRKDFKSIMQLNQHLSSKNHRKAEQELNKKNKNSKGGGNKQKNNSIPEDPMANQFERLDVEDTHDVDDNNDSDDAMFKTKRNDKKKKKKEKKKLQNTLYEDENSDSGGNDDDVQNTVFQLRGGKGKQPSSSSFSCRECLAGRL